MAHRIPIKNAGEIAKMRIAGKVAADIVNALGAAIKPGITTKDLDDYARDLFALNRCKSTFLGYRGYTGQVCISVNEEVVHGIGGPRILMDGDIVSIDAGATVNGWIGDNAATFACGNVSPDRLRLMAVTEESLFQAIDRARAGVPLAELCAAVEAYVKPRGYSIVRDFVGHGVGRELHEEPQIPNYRPSYSTPRLQPGMVLAIEPMVNMGTPRVRILKDGWTVVTADGQPSAHFEHTVLVTPGEPEILTPRPRIALPEQLGITL